MAAIPATQPHAAQLLALRAALDTLPPLPPRATLLDELLAAATAAPAVPALRSAWQARAALQPHVAQAATLRDAGCNPLRQGLQPYATWLQRYVPGRRSTRACSRSPASPPPSTACKSTATCRRRPHRVAASGA